MIKNLVIVALLTLNCSFAWYLINTRNDLAQPAIETRDPMPIEARTPNPGALNNEPTTVDSDQPVEFDIQTFNGDYQMLVEQLQQAGYGEDLIKQIILATIDRDHLLIQANESNTPYWRKRDDDPTAVVMEELKWAADKRLTLVNLFGPDIIDDPLFEALFKPLDKTLPFLSSEKQVSLYELQKIETATARAILQGGFTREARQDRRTAREEMEEKVRQLLSPDEYFEYQVRDSRLAQQMRNSMEAFDYSEQEFRDIFRLRQATEGTDFRFTDRASFEEQRAISEQRVKDYLGPDRYEAYARAQDPTFRALQSIGDRYGNSSAEIIEVYNVNAQAQDEITEIRNQQSLSRDERQKRINEIRQESYEEIKRIAGEDTANSVSANARQMSFRRGRPAP